MSRNTASTYSLDLDTMLAELIVGIVVAVVFLSLLGTLVIRRHLKRKQRRTTQIYILPPPVQSRAHKLADTWARAASRAEYERIVPRTRSPSPPRPTFIADIPSPTSSTSSMVPRIRSFVDLEVLPADFIPGPSTPTSLDQCPVQSQTTYAATYPMACSPATLTPHAATHAQFSPSEVFAPAVATHPILSPAATIRAHAVMNDALTPTETMTPHAAAHVVFSADDLTSIPITRNVVFRTPELKKSMTLRSEAAFSMKSAVSAVTDAAPSPTSAYPAYDSPVVRTAALYNYSGEIIARHNRPSVVRLNQGVLPVSASAVLPAYAPYRTPSS